MDSKLPNFLLLGPPRAATTWLFKCAESHPEIFASPVKQVHYFDKNLDRGLSWYRSHFASAGNEPVRGEFTPDYLALPDGPRLIRETLGPDVRLFVILRDPVERAFSEYLLCLREDWCQCDFVEAVKTIDVLENNGLYGAHIARYREHFPEGNIHFLPFNELEHAPEVFLRRFLSGLGVDTGHVPPFLDRVVNADHADARYKPLVHMGASARQLLERSASGRKLVWWLRNSGIVGKWHRFTAKDDTPILDQASRLRVLERFSQDLENLQQAEDVMVDIEHGNVTFRVPGEV